MANLEWNVYQEYWNQQKIKIINIFDYGGFRKDINNILNCATALTKEEFKERVRCTLSYYFWSKSEYEIVLTSWPPYISENERVRINQEADRVVADGRINRVHNIIPHIGEKIDVYDQVMLNFDRFIDYLWSKRGDVNEQ